MIVLHSRARKQQRLRGRRQINSKGWSWVGPSFPSFRFSPCSSPFCSFSGSGVQTVMAIRWGSLMSSREDHVWGQVAAYLCVSTVPASQWHWDHPRGL